jgi:hypothetical protein
MPAARNKSPAKPPGFFFITLRYRGSVKVSRHRGR